MIVSILSEWRSRFFANRCFGSEQSAYKVIVWTLLALCTCGRAIASDVKQVPCWDGETGAAPDGPLLNRFGGNFVYRDDSKITLNHITDSVYSGNGAYCADITGPVADYDFFQMALSGFFGQPGQYVMTRDISRFASLRFWIRNETGTSYTLRLELKDYRNSNDHRQWRDYPISADNDWREISAPLDTANGWSVIGDPDLQQTRIISFIFEALPNQPIQGPVYFDELQLIEPGAPLDPATADLSILVRQIAHRQFDGLWGSRSRVHGLVPKNSVHANIAALNSSAALVKILPAAIELEWVSQSEADAYITALVATLNTMMNNATYLPSRYVDWENLMPNEVYEESPIDAAFMALALYQYQSLPVTPEALRAQIAALLARFDFAAFGTPQGWKLAYKINDGTFTDGTYDGYSGEIWTISLAAQLMPEHTVDIVQYYHTGVLRAETFCADQNLAHFTHTFTELRAPFVQWLFPLFVNLESYSIDTYPIFAQATNPLRNAIAYQRDTHLFLAQSQRPLLLQPDAGDDGSGYRQYSCYNNFGQPDLFMPWSVAFSLLADPDSAAPVLRNHFIHGLHGPLGLSDVVRWNTGANNPAVILARHDFWNVGLSTMALISYMVRDNEYFSNLPEVHTALQKVFRRLMNDTSAWVAY